MSKWKNEDEMFALMREKLYTPVVGDILDQKGYVHQFLPPDIRPLRDDMKLAGKAMTVLMIDVFGEQKKPRGAVGAVLNGWHRDTPQVLAQNWPVFSCGCYAQDSSVRTQVVQFRCTIEIGQVTIHDGDIIFGDIDGVLVIPKEIAEEVIELALEKAAGEKLVRKAIEGGMSATDAFAKFGIL